MENSTHICHEKHSWALDNGLRRMFQPPVRITDQYIQPGMKIIDLGCGPGYFTIPMAQKAGTNGQVTAVDVQAGMLVRLRKRVEGTQLERRIILHQCSQERIGLAEQFDFALAFYMIHEVPDQENFLTEVYELLKPNAQFLIVEPKGHVSLIAFQETINIAKKIGFGINDGPRIVFSHSALLIKKIQRS